MISVKANIGNC